MLINRIPIFCFGDIAEQLNSYYSITIRLTRNYSQFFMPDNYFQTGYQPFPYFLNQFPPAFK